MSTVFIVAVSNDSTLLFFLNNVDRPMKYLILAVRFRTWHKLSFVVLKCIVVCLFVCFFRNGPPVQYGKVMDRRRCCSASQRASFHRKSSLPYDNCFLMVLLFWDTLYSKQRGKIAILLILVYGSDVC